MSQDITPAYKSGYINHILVQLHKGGLVSLQEENWVSKLQCYADRKFSLDLTDFIVFSTTIKDAF